jgi:hypothetical protein
MATTTALQIRPDPVGPITKVSPLVEVTVPARASPLQKSRAILLQLGLERVDLSECKPEAHAQLEDFEIRLALNPEVSRGVGTRVRLPSDLACRLSRVGSPPCRRRNRLSWRLVGC